MSLDDFSSPENLDDSTILDKMMEEATRYLKIHEEKFSISFDLSNDQKYPMPKWFGDQKLYSDILQTYSTEIKKLKEKEELLKNQLSLLNSNQGGKENDISQQIRELTRQRDNLRKQTQQAKDSKDQREKVKNYDANRLREREKELRSLQAKIEKMEENKKEYETNLLQYTDEIEKVYKENKQVQMLLNKATKDVETFRRDLAEHQNAVTDCCRQREELTKKNDALAKRVNELEAEKTESDLKIQKIQELLSDHDQMIAAHDLAQKQLQREEEIEKTAIAKMNESLEAATEYNNEANRLKTEAASLKQEVERSRQNLSDTLANLKENARRKITAINYNYEGKIEEADKQLTKLLEENAQLSASIETLRRQLTFIESQNAVLRADDGRGKTAFEEFTRGAKTQLDVLNSQLSDLTRESQKLKDEEQRQKSKLAAAESEAEKTNSAARKNVDKLESDLAQIKASLSEAEAAGAALLAENNRLQSELSRVTVDSKRNIELKVAEKDTELRMLSSKLDETRRSHIEKMSQLQKVFLQNKRFAEQWKAAAENAAATNEQQLQEKEDQVIKTQQQVAQLTAEVQNYEAEAEQAKAVLIKKQEEIAQLRKEVEQAEMKESKQKAQLAALADQQLQYASQKAQMQNEIDEKKTTLKRMQREYQKLVKANKQ